MDIVHVVAKAALVQKAGRGGKNGTRELQRRVALFDAGQWDVLLDASRATRATPSSRPPGDLRRQHERLSSGRRQLLQKWGS